MATPAPVYVDVSAEDVSIVWVLIVSFGVAMTAAVWVLAFVWIIRICFHSFQLRPCLPFQWFWRKDGTTTEWHVVLQGERRLVCAKCSPCLGFLWVSVDEEEVWNRSWDGRDEMQCCVTTDVATFDFGPHSVTVVSEFLRGENGMLQPLMLLAVDSKEVKSGHTLIDIVIEDRMWYFYTYGSIAFSLFLICVIIELVSGLHPLAATFLGGMMSVCAFFCSLAGYSWLRWSIKRDTGWPMSGTEMGPVSNERGGGRRRQQQRGNGSSRNNNNNSASIVNGNTGGAAALAGARKERFEDYEDEDEENDVRELIVSGIDHDHV